jgi:methanethiol S-methyltransferase
MFRRTAMLAYGVICYAVFFATFVYAIGVIDNLFVPTALDADRTHGIVGALTVDIGLLALFAIQHSVMARQFKRAWTKFIPAVAERSTYVLLASACLDVQYAALLALERLQKTTAATPESLR